MSGNFGQQQPSDSASEFAVIQFLIRQQLAIVRTAIPVQVKAVTTIGQVGPVGFVDVLPLVNLLDGQGNATKHITVYNLPYSRLQGGKNAIIIDPEVGDIGWAMCADRDISSVKANKAQANPGSGRRFDLADGIYVGGILNAAPDQYLRFYDDHSSSGSGIELIDRNVNKIQLTKDGIKVTDKNNNIVLMDSSGIKLTDKNNNVTTMNSAGIEHQDDNGNTIVMASAGITINGILFDRSQNVSNAHNINGTGEVTFNTHTLTQHRHAQANDSAGNTEQQVNTPTG